VCVCVCVCVCCQVITSALSIKQWHSDCSVFPFSGTTNKLVDVTL